MKETIFNMMELETAFEKAVPEQDECGDMIKRVFLGSVCDLIPSGKFYAAYALSNVTEVEAEEDSKWYDRVTYEFDVIGACLENGDGDPTDLFAVRLVGSE